MNSTKMFLIQIYFFFFLKETQWNKVRNQLKEIWEIHKYVEIK